MPPTWKTTQHWRLHSIDRMVFWKSTFWSQPTMTARTQWSRYDHGSVNCQIRCLLVLQVHALYGGFRVPIKNHNFRFLMRLDTRCTSYTYVVVIMNTKHWLNVCHHHSSITTHEQTQNQNPSVCRCRLHDSRNTACWRLIAVFIDYNKTSSSFKISRVIKV